MTRSARLRERPVRVVLFVEIERRVQASAE